MNNSGLPLFKGNEPDTPSLPLIGSSSMAKKSKKAETTEKTETPEMRALRQIGTLLFGQRWQSDFARAIKLDLREMRYCVVGGREMRLPYWKTIRTLLAKRKERDMEKLDDYARKVDAIIEKLERRAAREERAAA